MCKIKLQILKNAKKYCKQPNGPLNFWRILPFTRKSDNFRYHQAKLCPILLSKNAENANQGAKQKEEKPGKGSN